MFIGITERIEDMMARDNTHPQDREREALFFIICGNKELYKLREQIYNFKEKCIEPEILESGICTSSKQLLKLGFNLYNSYSMDSVMDTLSALDEYNFEIAMRAIRLRFNRVLKEPRTESEAKPIEKLNFEDYLTLCEQDMKEHETDDEPWK